MERMQGTVRPYAWGSTTTIPHLLGQEPTGEPQAELWLGAHPAGASSVGGRPLDAAVGQDPERYLGRASLAAFGRRLPFLLKVLAAARPLSLQAHPSRAQAEAGFAREEAAGIGLDDPARVYADDWPKPELLCALEDFDALCGFREPAETYALFAKLGVSPALEVVEPLRAGGADALEAVFTRILTDGDVLGSAAAEVVAAAADLHTFGDADTFARTAVQLAEDHPGDPGILAALLMNRIALTPGQAVFLPAGNLHAYLSGTGIEVMANSDNVLRGGLTSKHIAVDELVTIVSFTPGAPPIVSGVAEAPGVWRYLTPAPEFRLWRLEVAGSVEVPGAGSGRVLLITAGSATARSSPAGDALTLDRGDALYLTADDRVELTGAATGFVAAAGV